MFKLKYLFAAQLFSFMFLFFNIKSNAQSNDSSIFRIPTLAIDDQIPLIINIKYDDLVSNTNFLIPVIENCIQKITLMDNSFEKGQLTEQLSLAYYINGKYDLSFTTGFKALQIYDSLNIHERVGRMYGELGYRLKRIDLKKAFTLMQKGIIVLEKMRSKEQLAKIYDNYGVLHEMNYRFDSSVCFYKKALQLKKELNDQHGLAYTYGNIFISFMQSNQPDQALYYLDSSIMIRKKINDQIGLAISYSYYGEFYQLSNQLNNAICYFNKSLQISDSLNYCDMQSQMHQKLADCYERKNNFKFALEHQKIFKQLQDSLLNESTNKAIADLQVKYQTAEKEKEIERKEIQLKTRSIQMLIILILLVAVVLGFIIFYILYRHGQRIRLHEKLANERQQRILAVLKAEDDERTRIASELHDGLGQLLSTARINIAGLDESIPESDKFLLQNAVELIDQSVSEVRQVSHNLMPVSLMRYGLIPAIEEMARQVNQSGKLKMTCHFEPIDLKFSESDERTVYRIIQELVNNIIKHAGASQIDLFFGEKSEGNTILELINDGKTLLQSAIDNGKGIGWKNIENRVALLNGVITFEPGKISGTITRLILSSNSVIENKP